MFYRCVGTEENGIFNFFRRIIRDRFGIDTDGDGIIRRCRVIFIADNRAAADGNRVTAVRLRSTVRPIMFTADGNRTESFGLCIITEGDGICRRRFRRVTHGDRVILRFATQPDSNRPFACFNVAAQRHRLHAGFGMVTDDNAIFANFTVTADDNAVRIVGVGFTADSDYIGTRAIFLAYSHSNAETDRDVLLSLDFRFITDSD